MLFDTWREQRDHMVGCIMHDIMHFFSAHQGAKPGDVLRSPA
jgi:hypothetical protein